MNRKQLLVTLMIILILILGFFNVRLNTLALQFKKDCTLNYNVSDECPCVAELNSTYEPSPFGNISYYEINITP